LHKPIETFFADFDELWIKVISKIPLGRQLEWSVRELLSELE
jgi:hypothetical protein